MAKKLSKIQVRRKLVAAKHNISLILVDKFRQADSFSPMSSRKLLELIEILERAIKRIK